MGNGECIKEQIYFKLLYVSKMLKQATGTMIPIPHSPFPIPHSPFSIPHSLFPIPHSSFPIHRFSNIHSNFAAN